MSSPHVTHSPFDDVNNTPETTIPATTTTTADLEGDFGAPGSVPVTVPELGATTATANPSAPDTATAPPDPAPEAEAEAEAIDPDADTAATDAEDLEDPSTDPADDQTELDTEDPETAQIPTEALDTLNGLAGLASPLLGAATAIPAAALQGASGLIPGLTSAVMPQLASALDQLGTTTPPGAPRGRIGRSADALSGGYGSMAGQGLAGDRARATSEALTHQVAALRDVEQQLSDILELSSARTDADRAAIEGIIGDVETALIAAGVQGNTPEAQASVLTALHQALDQAGDVVSDAARDKLNDAQFVRTLISTYLTAAGNLDAPGVAGPGLGADAAHAARKALGLPYVWGGGGALGPTGGGFDCSGLTQFAVAQGSGGRVMLPRTTYDQIKVGAQVPLGGLSSGDLVFSNFSSPGVPEHVAIYIGGGQVIEAPQRGQPVQISGLPSGAHARRVL